MIHLILSLTHFQREELKEHLSRSGYHTEWISNNILAVDEDEVEYVKTILTDMDIDYIE